MKIQYLYLTDGTNTASASINAKYLDNPAALANLIERLLHESRRLDIIPNKPLKVSSELKSLNIPNILS